MKKYLVIVLTGLGLSGCAVAYPQGYVYPTPAPQVEVVVQPAAVLAPVVSVAYPYPYGGWRGYGYNGYYRGYGYNPYYPMSPACWRGPYRTWCR